MARDPSSGLPFEILRHRHRRHVLATLVRSETPVTVRDVRNEVVAREYAATLPDVPADDVTEIHLALVHVHVPMLAEAGLVDYDPDRALIEPTDLEAVRPWLSVADEDQSPEHAR